MHWIAILSFVSNRVPKNRDVAGKWSIALGFEPQNHIYGFVCFEHFADEDFKRTNKTELHSHAIPKVEIIAQNIAIHEDQNVDAINSECPFTSIIEAVESNTHEFNHPNEADNISDDAINSKCQYTLTIAAVEAIFSN